MSNGTSGDMSDFSMHDLFRVEAESQTALLITSLLGLERDPVAATHLESAMRASHSLKGAARIINLDAGVRVAHVMEDCFVAAQKGQLALSQAGIDLLLRGVDLLSRIANTPETELAVWAEAGAAEVEAFTRDLADLIANGPSEPPVVSKPSLPEEPAAAERHESDRVLRVTADNLNRILGLAGESLVESRWLGPFADSLVRMKRQHADLAVALDSLRESLSRTSLDDRVQTNLLQAQNKVVECRKLLADRLVELEMFDRRFTNLSHRLYAEALSSRMRPFADGVQAFPRMVRDLSRNLGKAVRLEIVGQLVEVDREVLEKLEAPLTHLLRNAVDHGFEFPEERSAAGKPAEGVLRLEARHSAGLLYITISDDGRGIDVERLRSIVVTRKLTNAETAERLSETELLDFLFLPGFSLKDAVTEISGRGVGLDIVQNMLKSVRGSVRVSTLPGKGTTFQLQLPLTLSVLRALLVEVGGEPYAFPLGAITRALRIPREQIESLEGRQHFQFMGQHVGLVTASQVLQSAESVAETAELAAVVLHDRGQTYGLVVDRLIGERELVVQPLDSRLGKIKDISAGALMEDGSPVLIIDVEDLVRSVEKLVAGGRLSKVQHQSSAIAGHGRKRVLVVDDSLTVRELERKLLESRGFEVEVAVDGMDGWNAARTGHFDLIISDVDMPRMDGIELVTLIKRDAQTRSIPVMIVSYKDREEDRRRGLEAGADYYLTKGSFHDETLLQAVTDLIGEPQG